MLEIRETIKTNTELNDIAEDKNTYIKVGRYPVFGILMVPPQINELIGNSGTLINTFVRLNICAALG